MTISEPDSSEARAWSVVLVAAPEEQTVARDLTEDEALALAITLRETEGIGEYHEVRQGEVAVWTTEAGELERVERVV